MGLLNSIIQLERTILRDVGAFPVPGILETIEFARTAPSLEFDT